MSRHLILSPPGVPRDAVTVVGFDHERRVFFCDLVRDSGITVPLYEDASAGRFELWTYRAGVRVPSALMARLRLEALAVSSVNAPYLDWRSGEPEPVREG